MKQVIQNYKTGKLELTEVPVPAVKSGGVLVENVNSLVSVGTEKLMIDMARKSLLGKARSRPDLVKQVIDKIKSDGLIEAYRQAMGRLDAPVPLGYSCAGEVVEAGEGVSEFKIGDRVACFGSGFASHAEFVSVPKNLCVKIPKRQLSVLDVSVREKERKEKLTLKTDTDISFEEAAFVGLGAIALHSVRMASPSLGDNVVVIGLGVLGLLAVQMLKACGCNVLGIDINPDKTKLAIELGADSAVVSGQSSAVSLVNEFTKGYGADAVIIFASTQSSEPVELAADIARERAKIVVPGMVKLDLPRKIFYEKELELVVSRSTGPGIYDPTYELKGIDYPISYVRWTEKRNMEEFLNLIAKGKIKIEPLITHRFPIGDAEKAYEMLLKGTEPYIGVLLQYPKEGTKGERRETKVSLKEPSAIGHQPSAKINVGLIGAGLFATGTLLPAIKGMNGLTFRGVATTTGATAHHAAKKYGFEYCTSDYHELLNDPAISTIIITTRHNLHAKLTIEALKTGKPIFVEKPLCINENELKEIIDIYSQLTTNTNTNNCLLMVGLNRRFSPFAIKAKEWMGNISEPLAIHCRVNAGFVPKDSWAHTEEGGGRIIGEVCHFIDLIQFFTNSLPVRVYAETLLSDTYQPSDNVMITLKMANGSIGSITYVANADKSFSRERIEIFGGGAACVIENFKTMSFVRAGKRKRMKRLGIDRGHKGEFQAFFDALLEGKPAPVAFEEYVYTTLATFAIEESLKNGKPMEVDFKVLKLL